MPLLAAKNKLIKDLEIALTEMKNAGAKDGANPNAAIKQYASAAANAIQSYMESASVLGTSTVPPRIAPSPLFGAGTHSGGPFPYSSGKVSFSSNSKLKLDIEAAEINAKTAGTADGASPDSIIGGLSKDLASGIHSFATTAIVSIQVLIPPGLPVMGFMMLTSPSPVPPPLPSFGVGTLGNGTGKLS